MAIFMQALALKIIDQKRMTNNECSLYVIMKFRFWYTRLFWTETVEHPIQ